VQSPLARGGTPLLLTVLTYITLYQTSFQGFFTMLIYAVGLSIPLIVISSPGGASGKKIKDTARVSGGVFDTIIGMVIALIGMYFLYLAFP
jgi:cytochrome c biogenesis protein CcdA